MKPINTLMLNKTVVFFSNKRLHNKFEDISKLLDQLYSTDKKILVVDFNPQCEITSYLLYQEDYSNESNTHTILDIISKDLEIDNSVVKKSNSYVDVIVGSILLEEFIYTNNIKFLQQFKSNFINNSKFDGYLKLFHFLDKLNNLSKYDIIIFDTNENNTILNNILLHYCDLHIYPIHDGSYLSIKFLQQFKQFDEKWKWVSKYIDTGNMNKTLKNEINTVFLIEDQDIKISDLGLTENIKIITNPYSVLLQSVHNADMSKITILNISKIMLLYTSSTDKIYLYPSNLTPLPFPEHWGVETIFSIECPKNYGEQWVKENFPDVKYEIINLRDMINTGN